jgi:hypothetical protein
MRIKDFGMEFENPGAPAFEQMINRTGFLLAFKWSERPEPGSIRLRLCLGLFGQNAVPLFDENLTMPYSFC